MFGARQVSPPGRYAPVTLFSALLIVFIVVTRWPLAPRYLYYFDSANFALSLEKFDPAIHQPQPPGYALFVGLIRLIHFWVERPERVLLIAGILAACAATLLIRFLAADMFGRKAGILAAALLASSPVFWFAGITNQVRLFLSVSALGVSALAWRALTRPERAEWFYAACAALGIAAGFRPVEATLFVPLLFWVWLRTGRSPMRLTIGAAALSACALPWILVTVAVAGGFHKIVEILWGYADVQFQGSSAVFGATRQSAYKMFAAAVVWTLLGSTVWLWVLPLVRWRPWTEARRRKAAFLAIAFVPSFLFSAFIHIGDPDQGLAGISILTIGGAGAISAYLDRVRSRRVFAISALFMAAHALIFFVPPTKLAKASSYKAVAAVDRLTSNAITTVSELRGQGPVTIVHYGSSVPSRHLQYYFPDDYVVVIPENKSEYIQLYTKRAAIPSSPVTGFLHPRGARVLCLAGPQIDASLFAGWKKLNGIYYLDSIPPLPFRIGSAQLEPPD
jgi:4-amino-4-deoxy-L-arabinose transferase-like glycosyltransferase